VRTTGARNRTSTACDRCSGQVDTFAARRGLSRPLCPGFRTHFVHRTVEATWQRIGQILGVFTSTECANYLRNSGYAST